MLACDADFAYILHTSGAQPIEHAVKGCEVDVADAGDGGVGVGVGVGGAVSATYCFGTKPTGADAGNTYTGPR